MNNNVICIFVDSVVWECVGTTRAKVSPTPFLDSLRNESLTATKLYSHGPYTDAAKTSLFTGRNCLDDFGYFFRENSSPITDFELFHENGYETYCLSYPFWLYGESIRKHIDHIIYTAGFVYGSEWGGLFKHYHELSLKRPLTDIEYKLLISRLQLFFEVYEFYLNDLLSSRESRILYESCLSNFDIQSALKILKEEYALFLADKIGYIDSFNSQGLDHKLASLDSTRIDSIISRSFLESIYHNNHSFFRKAIHNNIRANWLSLLPSIKRTFFGLKRSLATKDRSHLTFWENYFLSLTPFNVMRKRWGTPRWQNDNSIHSILKAGIQLIEERRDSEKPFYMYLNTDDPHNNIAMFAYDIQNLDIVNEEIRVLKNYVDELDVDFKGSLLYLLSLRYVDYEIEQFCKRLKELGIWKETTLMVVSDHGSSYSFSPIHNARVNCFDDECYHIPMLIRHPGFKGIEIHSYQNSKDILPTVCDLVGIPKSVHFRGHSMIDNSRPIYPYVITEYMGPGCPDMTSKRMWMSIRDANFIIAYKVGIYEDFGDGELAEVYDLNKDPNGLYNINYKIDIQRITYLLNPLKDRFEQIKEDTLRFLDNLETGIKIN